MRYYELVILINLIEDHKYDLFIDSIKNFLNNNGGVVHKYEHWGKRKLAYRIKNLEEAYYLLMYIECDNKTLLSLNKEIKYNTFIIRHIILKINQIENNISPLSINYVNNQNIK